MIRWYQYGVFTPIFRTHSVRPNNEAWTVGGDTYKHIRAAIFLRERLRPYVMEQMELAAERGIPPMRPLFFDFEKDPLAVEIEDQFLFGPDLLVAPITHYKKRNREVYLPNGIDWTDVWTKETHLGGQKINAEAPIEQIPVFMRNNNAKLVNVFDNLYAE